MHHGAVSARADQDPHKNPTTGPGRGLPPCPGEGPPRSKQPGLCQRARIRHQPAGAGLPVPAREALAVLQLQPQRPQTRLPADRLARPDGNGSWTWHSLRHVFCTTALFTWKLDVTDVSRMAGYANYRITLDM
jgi:hypothetical protein